MCLALRLGRWVRAVQTRESVFRVHCPQDVAQILCARHVQVTTGVGVSDRVAEKGSGRNGPGIVSCESVSVFSSRV